MPSKSKQRSNINSNLIKLHESVETVEHVNKITLYRESPLVHIDNSYNIPAVAIAINRATGMEPDSSVMDIEDDEYFMSYNLLEPQDDASVNRLTEGWYG